MKIEQTSSYEHHKKLELYLYGGAQKREVSNVYVSWVLNFSVFEGDSKIYYSYTVGAGIRDGAFVWGTVQYIPKQINIADEHALYLTKEIKAGYIKLADLITYYDSDQKVSIFKAPDGTVLSKVTDEDLLKGWKHVGHLDPDVSAYKNGGFIPDPGIEVEPPSVPARPIYHVVWIKPLKSWKWMCYLGDDMYECIIPENVDIELDYDSIIDEKWNSLATTHLLNAIQQKNPDQTSASALVSNEWTAKHPVRNEEQNLQSIIIDLNDYHEWSRERIADWLDTLDEQPTFYKKERVSVTPRMVTLKPPVPEEATN